MAAENKRTALPWGSQLLRSLTSTGTALYFEQRISDIERLEYQLRCMCRTHAANEALREGPWLLEDLTSATMSAMQLVAACTRQCQDKPVLLQALNILFSSLMLAVEHQLKLEGESQASRYSVARQFDELGFMPVLSDTASALHTAMTAGSERLAHTTATALESRFFLACCALFGAWPSNTGTTLVGSSISQTVAPLSKLVLAYMRYCGRVRGCSQGTSMLNAFSIDPACHLADVFKVLLVEEVVQKDAVSSERPEAAAYDASTLASGDLLLLLLAYLACFLKLLHDKQQGASTVTVAECLKGRGLGALRKQELLVPAYHGQVLVLLGISDEVEMSVKGPLTECADPLCVVHLICLISGIQKLAFIVYESTPQAAAFASAAGLGDSATGDAVDGTADSLLPVAALLPSGKPVDLPKVLSASVRSQYTAANLVDSLATTAPAVAELLDQPGRLLKCTILLLIELQLLVPDCQLLMHSLFWSAALFKLPDCFMDAVDLDAVQAQLIQPILHLMGPAALYACKVLDEAAAGQALKHFVLMCELPSQRSSHEAGAAQVLTAYAASPLSCSAVVEAALRLLTKEVIANKSELKSVQKVVSFSHLCAWLCVQSAVNAQTADASAETEERDSQCRLALQQYALLVTVLKSAGISLEAGPGFRWTVVQIAGLVINTAALQLEKAVCCQLTEAQERRCGSTKHNKDIIAAWLVLLARSYNVLADLLLADHPAHLNQPLLVTLPSFLDRSSCGLLSPQKLFLQCIDSLEILCRILPRLDVRPGDQRSTGARTQQDLQQLLDSFSAVLQRLQQSASGSLASEGDTSLGDDGKSASVNRMAANWRYSDFVGIFDQEVLKQLCQTAADMIALLPLPYCCNNPACRSMASLSELKLANSKGSRCAGCKCARYCGRQCQLQHWRMERGHRAVCKRLQASVSGQ